MFLPFIRRVSARSGGAVVVNDAVLLLQEGVIGVGVAHARASLAAAFFNSAYEGQWPVSVAADEGRLVGISGGGVTLLVEQSATTSLGTTDEIKPDPTSWTATGVALAASENPYNTIVEDDTTGPHAIYQTIAGAAPGTYTLSVIVRAPTFDYNRYVRLVIAEDASNYVFATFLSNGEVNQAATAVGTPTAAGHQALEASTPDGPNIVRMMVAASDITPTRVLVVLADASLPGTTEDFGVVHFEGVDDAVMQVSAIQLETGAGMTSPIVTGDSPTRAADVVTVADLAAAGIDPLVGTFVIDFHQVNSGVSNGDGVIFAIDDGTGDESLAITISWPITTATLDVVSDSNSAADSVDITGLSFGRTVVAVAYDATAGDFAFSINESAVVAASMPEGPVGLTTVRIGHGRTSGIQAVQMRNVTYYPRRISDAELPGLSSAAG